MSRSVIKPDIWKLSYGRNVRCRTLKTEYSVMRFECLSTIPDRLACLVIPLSPNSRAHGHDLE